MTGNSFGKQILLLVLLCLPLWAAGFSVDKVRADIIAFEGDQNCSPVSEPIEAYATKYNLPIDEYTYCIGSFVSDDYRCIMQMFSHENASGTLILLHGYYDHAGTVRNIINSATSAGWNVAVLDMPGHGISSGKRASIETFDHYTNALNRAVNIVKARFSGPYVLSGHSTGCAVITDYLHSFEDRDISGAIFFAPLVRMSLYGLSKIGHTLLRPIIDNTLRWNRKSSSDKEFLREYKQDPLQYSKFPMQWADAYYQWEEKVQRMRTVTVPLVVIQGDNDNVVDWKYNLAFLKSKFEDYSENIVEGARHQLMNESEELKREVFIVFQNGLKLFSEK